MKYTILTVNYNHRDGLLRTIQSVLSQTSTEWEFLVIDGGSTDGSVEVIQQYASHIRYWVSEPDGGVYAGMNKGIVQARGEYIHFLNSGDVYAGPEVLERMAPHLGADIVLGDTVDGRRAWRFGRQEITMLNLFHDGLQHQAAFIRRSLFEGHLYDESLRIVADWAFFIDALVERNASFRYVPIEVCLFEPGGQSDRYGEQLMAERRAVLHRYLPPRIYADYERLARADNRLLELTPALNRTYRLNRLAYRLVKSLIQINRLLPWRRSR
jgi:glycosyltransferase involved in cell wall biosynthesis